MQGLTTQKANDAAKIIERLKQEYGFTSDIELANFLGIKGSSLSSWKLRDSVNIDLLFAKFKDLSLDWLLHGIGQPRISYAKSNVVSEESITYETTRGIPLFLCPAPAGSPTPASDEVEATLSCNAIIPHWERCFACRVTGDSMIGAGIASGDTLIVERGENSTDGDIVVCSLNGELTVKRLRRLDGGIYLYPENARYPAMRVFEEDSLIIWGTVMRVIKSFYNLL